MANLVLEEAEEKMKKTVEATRREFNGIRTGRATPRCWIGSPWMCTGTQLPLNQVATISVPEARLLMISPWDKGTIPAIERSIMKSDLGAEPLQ